MQSAKTVSLTQEQLEIHVTRLCKEIKVLDDKEQATAYETEAVKLLLEQRVTLLEEDLQAVRNRWKQEVEDFQKASAMELNSEREKLKQSAALKIKTLQENLNASEAMYTAEKAERERLAAEVEKAHDPFAWARKVQAAEEEAELLACRQKAKADELIRHPTESQAIPIHPQTASTLPVLAASWPGHDGSSSCFRGLGVQPKSEAAPGAQISQYLLTDDSPTEAEAVPIFFHRVRSPSETIPMEQQQEKQTQPAQSMQEPEEPPIQEQQGAAGPLSDQETPPMEDQQDNAQADLQGAAEPLADLQVAAEPLTKEEDGAETAHSWSMCGAESSWVHVPDLSECPESNDGEPVFYMYKSVREARGISNIFTLSWESFIFKYPSLELVCSNPSRTCFPNCSTGICRHGATHQLAETHVRIQEMVTTKRLRSKHI